ncbi:MAG: hypothetical protein CVU56_13665 [Deltaproteobacteria bacterium HGW-Deltaproteobacteria-14]|nr:MAG: hypothetical protein CVU56_13665 [Deltaproteobacteria bacterium HGW-Deltaproteobacteria-14]
MRVAHTWDGAPIPAGERAHIRVTALPRHLRLDVDAPFFGDPPPPGPPGPTGALWEHEVVELFLLGPGERYTEVELGPHGHHLVLRLEGRRNPVATLLPLDFTARVGGARWRGVAELPVALLPPGPLLVNAYAIHGVGPARRHLAMTPVPGPAPDFHRIDAFTVRLPR